MKKVVFIFGRFQVPTKGHAEMIRFGADYARRIGAEFRVYTSKSWDHNKNPLPYQQKIAFLHQLFPGLNIVDDPTVKTAFDICRKLSDQGVEEVTMIVGGDRVAEFQRSIGKYVMDRNDPKFDKTKNYAFTKFNVINSGARKTGVSGTQMRDYIRRGKFKEFLGTAPTTDKRLAKQIFTVAKANLNEAARKKKETPISQLTSVPWKTAPVVTSSEKRFLMARDENAKKWDAKKKKLKPPFVKAVTHHSTRVIKPKMSEKVRMAQVGPFVLPMAVTPPQSPIYKNPTTEAFDKLARKRGLDTIRVLFADGDWYFWDGAAFIHADIIKHLKLSADYMQHMSDIQNGRKNGMYGIQLFKTDDGSFEPTHDLMDGFQISIVRQRMKNDKKFNEITKNWNILHVHKAAPSKQQMGFEKLRAKVQRDIDMNLAEGKQYAIATRAKTKSGWRRVPDTRFDTEESARRYGDKYHTDRSGAKMYRVIEHPDNKKNLREDIQRKDFDGMLQSFIDFTVNKLDIKNPPQLAYKDPADQGEQPSFAGYAPGEKKVFIQTKNRHPMDIFRSVAHELVHHKQNEDGKLKDIAQEGSTGSPIEDEANYMAGRVMRWFGKANPDMFGKTHVVESKAIILGGVPGSGKDKILKEAILPHGFREVSDRFDINECNGDNLVINGTMADYNHTKEIKDLLEGAGYETIMVFVNTSNEVSKQRNEARAFTGGRVINEDIRYDKWRKAQFNLNRYDTLFEKVIEVKNDLDASTIKETYEKFVDSISKEIEEFATNEADRKFEMMLEGNFSDFAPKKTPNPVGGAGNWGTPKLTDRYKGDTPGQEPGVTRPMGYFKPFRQLSITADSMDQVVNDPISNVWNPIDRWMVREETRKRFKAKYGALADKKLQETAERLKKESLDDPYSGSMGCTPNATNIDDRSDLDDRFEKMVFRKTKPRKTK